jgi:hypothetical protein
MSLSEELGVAVEVMQHLMALQWFVRVIVSELPLSQTSLRAL